MLKFFILFFWLPFPFQNNSHGDIFRGENCSACHTRIRDRLDLVERQKLKVPIEDYDAVVVGGGFAGLSAAYFLRDLRILLLEKEERVGGHGLSDSWQEIPYPTASVYFNSKPYGAWAELFRDLGLKSIEIPAPQDTLVITRTQSGPRKIVENYWDEGIENLPYDAPVKENFRRFNKDIKDFIASDLFHIPVSESKPQAWQHDQISFWDYLAPRYGEIVATYVGRHVQDMLGAGPKEISAFAGILMLCSADGYYTWESGLNPLAEALERKLKGRIRTGSLVVRVEQRKNRVLVSYEKGGEIHRVRAKAVILAIPAHVMGRILSPIPEEKKKALSQVRYSAYVVTMLGFRKPVWRKSYMLWSDNTTRFTSLLFTDWPIRSGQGVYTGPQVVLAYTPLGSEQARAELLDSSDHVIQKQTLIDLEKVLPGASENVEEMRVIRWGHAEPIPYPGYLSRIRPLVAEPMGRVFFAGEATEAPAMEGAIFSAYRAQAELRRFLAREN